MKLQRRSFIKAIAAAFVSPVVAGKDDLSVLKADNTPSKQTNISDKSFFAGNKRQMDAIILGDSDTLSFGDVSDFTMFWDEAIIDHTVEGSVGDILMIT